MLAIMAQYLFQLGSLHVSSPVVCAGVLEEPFSSLALSYSHCPASTSCLVDPPILPAWPISVLLKYMIDRIQTILPHHFPPFFFKTKENTHSPFVGNVGIVFQATSCWLGALIILWGPKENLGL